MLRSLQNSVGGKGSRQQEHRLSGYAQHQHCHTSVTLVGTPPHRRLVRCTVLPCDRPQAPMVALDSRARPLASSTWALVGTDSRAWPGGIAVCQRTRPRHSASDILSIKTPLWIPTSTEDWSCATVWAGSTSMTRVEAERPRRNSCILWLARYTLDQSMQVMEFDANRKANLSVRTDRELPTILRQHERI